MLNKGYMLMEVRGNYAIIPTNNSNVKMSTIYNINETAAYIFKSLSKGMSKDEIINEFLKEYDIDKSSFEADYDEFIEELKKRGIYE